MAASTRFTLGLLGGARGGLASLRSSWQPSVGKSSKAQKARRKAARLQDPLELPPPASEFPAYEGRDFFRFELVHQSKKPGSRARVGRIHTPHGIIDTPGFVPVGTNGVLKCIELPKADEAGMQLMFCNTYHLMIHPGPETIAGGFPTFFLDEKGLGLAFFFLRGPIISDSSSDSRSLCKRIACELLPAILFLPSSPCVRSFSGHLEPSSGSGLKPTPLTEWSP